jgi:hypothetical protein
MRAPNPALVAAVRDVLTDRQGAPITGHELLDAVRARGVAVGNLRRCQEVVALLVEQGVPVASTSSEGRRDLLLEGATDVRGGEELCAVSGGVRLLGTAALALPPGLLTARDGCSAVRFVEQSVLGAPGGNCVAACLATVLGVDLAELPDLSPEGVEERIRSGSLSQPPGGWDPQDWAIAEHVRPLGLTVASIAPWCTEGGPYAFTRLDLEGLSIASAWSHRVPGHGHAVVALDGGIVWDPHPQRHMGVGPVYGWLIFEREGRRLRP